MSKGIEMHVQPEGVAARARTRAAEQADAGKPDEKAKSSPVILIALLALAGLLGWIAVQHANKPSLAAGMPAPAVLLAPAAACADVGQAAIGRAIEAEQAALAKVERSKFDAHDGVDAVALYGLASNCYTQGSDTASTARLVPTIARLQAMLNIAYQSHQLKLRLALDRGARNDALREVKAQRVLLRTNKGPYVEWLAKLEHDLISQLTDKKKKKKLMGQ